LENGNHFGALDTFFGFSFVAITGFSAVAIFSNATSSVQN